MNEMASSINFTKMQGAGNDFVIIDNRKEQLSKDAIISMAPDLCDRRFGIGADGIITLQPATQDSLDYEMFYRNADGSDAGMCGNGARCLALFASKCGLGNELSFNVHDVIYRAEVDGRNNNVVIHFPMQVKISKVYPDIPQKTLFQIYTGTEHLVKLVDQATLDDEKYLIKEGRRLRNHPDFDPPGTNVNFIRGAGPQSLHIKTYERGVESLTLACGTGAIAGALAWHTVNQGPVDKSQRYEIIADGGTLEVGFVFKSAQKEYMHIKLSGEAQLVFEGTF